MSDISRSNHPNIILLLSDQHRFDATSANGNPICLTPGMERLAREGMTFESAYTTNALCTPARASIVTGLYPHNHGELANLGNFNGVFDNQVLGKPHMNHFLKEQGYRIGIAGKWHLPKSDGRSIAPLMRGETPEDWRTSVMCEFHGYEPALCTIRLVENKKWKYVYNPCSEDELYDLESDPGELNNLAPMRAFKHVLRRMKDLLVRHMEETGDSIVEQDSWKGTPYDLYISERER